MLIVDEVGAERTRQDLLWGQQDHPNAPKRKNGGVLMALQASNAKKVYENAAKRGAVTWPLILTEEVAEAYEQAALGDEAALREELIQCAAVCVAWIECIDRRKK
jgi:hypothetical protein